jgi:hypothetical protein
MTEGDGERVRWRCDVVVDEDAMSMSCSVFELCQRQMKVESHDALNVKMREKGG